jgi:hypothetical protein
MNPAGFCTWVLSKENTHSHKSTADLFWGDHAWQRQRREAAAGEEQTKRFPF